MGSLYILQGVALTVGVALISGGEYWQAVLPCLLALVSGTAAEFMNRRRRDAAEAMAQAILRQSRELTTEQAEAVDRWIELFPRPRA